MLAVNNLNHVNASAAVLLLKHNATAAALRPPPTAPGVLH